MQIAGTAVISKRHMEVVNIRTAGAASKCSAGNAIRIRPNSLKPLFGTPLVPIHYIHEQTGSSNWPWIRRLTGLISSGVTRNSGGGRPLHKYPSTVQPSLPS